MLAIAAIAADDLAELVAPFLLTAAAIEVAGLVTFWFLTRRATGALAALLTYMPAGIPAAFLTNVLICLGLVVSSLVALGEPILYISSLAAWFTLQSWLRPGRLVARLGRAGLERIVDELADEDDGRRNQTAGGDYTG